MKEARHCADRGQKYTEYERKRTGANVIITVPTEDWESPTGNRSNGRQGIFYCEIQLLIVKIPATTIPRYELRGLLE